MATSHARRNRHQETHASCHSLALSPQTSQLTRAVCVLFPSKTSHFLGKRHAQTAGINVLGAESTGNNPPWWGRGARTGVEEPPWCMGSGLSRGGYFGSGIRFTMGPRCSFFFLQCSWRALARCLPSATSDGRPEKDARGPSPGARRRCSPGTGEDGGGRGQAPRPRAAWEAWTPAPRLLWTHPQKGQGVTGSRILPVTVAGNTVGGLYLYWTQEEPGVGWLGSFFAHFLHPRAIC